MIVIVDDEKSHADLLKELIRDEYKDLNVLTIPNGKAALPIVRINEKKIKLIITDLHMPHMNGEELIATLKQEIKSEIPIIMVSGYSAGLGTMKLSKKKNINFLQKPYEINELLSLISNYI